MAKTLLESIKQQMSTKPAAPVPGETERTREALRAKTGAAVAAPGGPRRTAMAEQAEIEKTSAAGEQVAAAGTIAGQQLAQQAEAQESAAEQATADLKQRQEANKQQVQQTFDSMINELRRGKETLTAQQKQANLEQLGFLYAHNNDKYVYALQDKGRRERLDDATEFDKQMTKSIIGHETEMALGEETWRDLMASDEREFRDKLSQMDLDAAIALADAEARQAQGAAMYGGLSQVLGGGLQYAASRPTSSKPESGAGQSATSTGGGSTYVPERD